MDERDPRQLVSIHLLSLDENIAATVLPLSRSKYRGFSRRDVASSESPRIPLGLRRLCKLLCGTGNRCHCGARRGNDPRDGFVSALFQCACQPPAAPFCAWSMKYVELCGDSVCYLLRKVHTDQCQYLWSVVLAIGYFGASAPDGCCCRTSQPVSSKKTQNTSGHTRLRCNLLQADKVDEPPAVVEICWRAQHQQSQVGRRTPGR